MNHKIFLYTLLSLLTCLPTQTQEFKPRADLPPLLEFLNGKKVETQEDFQQRKTEIRNLLQKYFIGYFPKTTPKLLQVEQISATSDSVDGDRKLVLKLTWNTTNKASFQIHLWIPKGKGPFPLLLTQPRYYQMRWAEIALERGYMVALYPGVDSHHREKNFSGYDSVWKTFRKEYPQATWTEISTKAWLASRTLDFLLSSESPAKVQEGQVSIIGFSRYGKQSMIATAFDERITCVVARSPGSPGSCPYRFTSRDTCAEAPSDFPSEWFLPSLRSFTGREHELPIDAHAWYALIAPRHCLIHTAHNDGSEPTFAVERAYLEGQKVYEFLNQKDNLRIHYRAGQHNPITEKQRQENLDWIDRAFGRKQLDPKAFPEEFIHHFDWEAWKATQSKERLDLPKSVDQAIQWMLGEKPETVPLASKAKFLTPDESKMMTHDRWAVQGVQRIPVNFGEGVRGNIYLKPDIQGEREAIIWLHPFSYHSGYNEGYGVQGTTVYHRLASQGYVVLAYDQCGFGLRLLEGRDFYKNNPHWSKLGRMVHDVQRAVDFLLDGKGESQSPLPKIDSQKVTVLGYALGSWVAIHAAALDQRIQRVACVSGLTPLRSTKLKRETGGLRKLWQWHALVPRLGLFEGKEAELPYDLDGLLKKIQPRPVWILGAHRDRTIDSVSLLKLSREVMLSSLKSNMTLIQPVDTQRFQKAQQEAFLSWLKKLP